MTKSKDGSNAQARIYFEFPLVNIIPSEEDRLAYFWQSRH